MWYKYHPNKGKFDVQTEQLPGYYASEQEARAAYLLRVDTQIAQLEQVVQQQQQEIAALRKQSLQQRMVSQLIDRYVHYNDYGDLLRTPGELMDKQYSDGQFTGGHGATIEVWNLRGKLYKFVYEGDTLTEKTIITIERL